MKVIDRNLIVYVKYEELGLDKRMYWEFIWFYVFLENVDFFKFIFFLLFDGVFCIEVLVLKDVFIRRERFILMEYLVI